MRKMLNESNEKNAEQAIIFLIMDRTEKTGQEKRDLLRTLRRVNVVSLLQNKKELEKINWANKTTKELKTDVQKTHYESNGRLNMKEIAELADLFSDAKDKKAIDAIFIA